MTPFDLKAFLEQRLHRWPAQFSYMPHAHHLASRAARNLLEVAQACAPCLKSAVLKTYAYGWLTARRFSNEECRFCLVGCARRCRDGESSARCPMESDDSLEHYMCCPHVQQAWTRFVRLHNDKGPLGMLGLADEDPAVVLARLAFLYCSFNVLAQLEVQQTAVAPSQFLRMMEERRRVIEARCQKVARALRQLRKRPRCDILAS